MYQNQINTRAHLHTHTLTYTPPHKPVQNVPINENRKQIRSTMLQLKRKKTKKGFWNFFFPPTCQHIIHVRKSRAMKGNNAQHRLQIHSIQ